MFNRPKSIVLQHSSFKAQNLKTMKTKVSLGLDSLSTPEKIVAMRKYAGNIDANPLSFPNAHPLPVTFRSTADDLELSYNTAQNGTSADTADLHKQEAIADALVVELGHYVEDLPTCTSELVTLLGLKVRGHGGQLPVVFKVKQGVNAGEVTLLASKVDGACYYFEKYKGATPPADGVTGWEKLGTSSRKASFFTTGFDMEVKYWFRVRPIVGQMEGTWETPKSIILV
jgi:hypothetical protein